MNDKVADEVTVLIQECLKGMESEKTKANETLKQLSSIKLVWSGAMLRNSAGSIEAWLSRDDVPDGELVCILPTVQPANAGRVTTVGRVVGKKASLAGTSETTLAGRPLFWIRPSKTNSN